MRIKSNFKLKNRNIFKHSIETSYYYDCQFSIVPLIAFVNKDGTPP